MSGVSFTVPGQPQGKGRPRFVKATGRAYTPVHTVRYETMIAYAALAAVNGRDTWQAQEPLACRIRAICAIPQSWPKKRKDLALQGEVYPVTKPDGDNICKAVGDALNGVIWRDDSQVVLWEIMKQYGPEPMLMVHVEAA